MSRLPAITRRTIARIGLVTVQWILLTISLGAVVVFSSDSLREFVEPTLDGSLIFFAAFIVAFVFGMSIESFKVLLPLVILMCLGASLVFAMVLLSPTFADVTVRTNSLENYAATRVFLFTVLMGLPALVGAGFGNLAGGFVRDDILGPEDQIDGVDRSSWYERRGGSTTATDTDSPQRGV